DDTDEGDEVAGALREAEDALQEAEDALREAEDDGENNRNSGDDHDKDNHDKDNHDGDNDGESVEITNSREQNADSGDLDQTVSITGPGDNASQCLGIQPIGNTGNAQNQVSVQPGGDNADDGNQDEDRKRDRNGDGKFTVEDLNTSIDVSPTNTVTCDQPINQAASASGDSAGYDSGGY
ncbi:MAG TPA: hypothetical protein VHF70_09630, partial [Rubrobacteraceae bacterium]|nr:hypothetical protein [Rubrobacteraceae bacterium]